MQPTVRRPMAPDSRSDRIPVLCLNKCIHHMRYGCSAVGSANGPKEKQQGSSNHRLLFTLQSASDSVQSRETAPATVAEAVYQQLQSSPMASSMHTAGSVQCRVSTSSMTRILGVVNQKIKGLIRLALSGGGIGWRTRLEAPELFY